MPPLTPPTLIVLGTTNRAKGRELEKLLAPVGLPMATLADFPDALEVEEHGESFAANAALKATQQARRLRQWVLGEDSGLVVDALDGAPGIYSARWSGPQATDQSNNQRLLDELAGVAPQRRAARYVCHAVVADPAGEIRAESQGSCQGRITTQPRGTHGFGYDPLFEIVEYHRTFGELGPLVKMYLSHRARAVAAMVPQLVQLKG